MSDDLDDLKAKRDRLKLERDIRNLEIKAKFDVFLSSPIPKILEFLSDLKKTSPMSFWFGLVVFVIFVLLFFSGA